MNLELNKHIFYRNESNFSEKIKRVIKSYSENKHSLIVISDFDYTMTSLFDYDTNIQYKSSYYLYDENIIGGNQKKFEEDRKNLSDEYSKYEFDTSYDFEFRKKKMIEWYTKNIELYYNPNFTLDSIEKMIQKLKHNIKFRPKLKEYIELLMEMDIPLIIESGGITQFIHGILKYIIPDIDELIEKKKIAIISNKFKFDPISKGCCGIEREVIHCFNKADFIGNIIKNEYKEAKNILVLGDNLGDADCVKKLDVDINNVIGFGFINLSKDILLDENKKEFIENKIKEYNNIFDMALVGNCDYQPIINLLKSFKNLEWAINQFY